MRLASAGSRRSSRVSTGLHDENKKQPQAMMRTPGGRCSVHELIVSEVVDSHVAGANARATVYQTASRQFIGAHVDKLAGGS